MTQAKKLKKKIRARAARTGESYGAARRQVTAARAKRLAAATPAAAAPVKPNLTRGGVSAAKVLARTGKTLDHWFAMLDAFDAKAKGHTAAARLRFKAGANTVAVNVDARPNGRASVVATVMKLAKPEDVESRRAVWRAAFESLRATLAR